MVEEIPGRLRYQEEGWSSLAFGNWPAACSPFKFLVVKCRSALFSHLPLFVENPSTISAASSIVLGSSVGLMRRFGGAAPFRTGARATVIYISNQVIYTAHEAIS